MFIFALKIVVVFILLVFLLGLVQTLRVEHSPTQTLFSAGMLPAPPLNGFYRGSVPGHTVSWLGKKFDAANSRGINLFTSGSTTTERYPFKTYVGVGVHDPHTQVLKIDYNVPANPFWLWPILDEVVEVAPGHYLGKLQARLVPLYPFTLAYFDLNK